MERIREIVKEELLQIVNETRIVKFEDHNIFSHPQRAAEYAMDWARKANELNKFYWQVANILGNLDTTQDVKIEQIEKLLPNYGYY